MGSNSRRRTVVAGEDKVGVNFLLSLALICALGISDAGAVIKLLRPVLDGEVSVHGHLVVRPCSGLSRKALRLDLGGHRAQGSCTMVSRGWAHNLVEGVDDSGWCETLMAIHGGDNALNWWPNSGCVKQTRRRGKDLQPQIPHGKPRVSPLHQDRNQQQTQKPRSAKWPDEPVHYSPAPALSGDEQTPGRSPVAAEERSEMKHSQKKV